MAQVHLTRFLAEAARRPFAWGQHDCLLFAADWVRALTGEDPAAPWRGAYASEAEAEAILVKAGGLGMLVRSALGPLGWTAKSNVKGAGDIAIIAAPTRTGRALVASIFAGRGRYAAVTARGLVFAPAQLMLAWAPPDWVHHG